MAGRAGRRSARVFQDDQIEQLLANSDFDDSGDDDEYIPSQIMNDESSSSETDTDDENIQSVSAQGQPRSSRGRVRSIRSQGRRSTSRGNDETSTEWSQNNDAVFTNAQLCAPSYLPFTVDDDLSKFDVIDHFIGEDLYEILTVKSNQTYVKNTGKSLNLTVKEVKLFFGITMLMSCVNYPILRMYWEKNWRVNIIADSMSRDRYFVIRNSLKLVYDDDVSAEQRAADKIWKVRPIFESVLRGCRKQVPEQDVSIDEMIIPFTGICGIKQYCPNKPNPVGLKAFILANPNGIVCDMVIYQGKTTFPSFTDAGFGLGESAVLHLAERLVPGTTIYYDRYFSTSKLAKELLARGIKCAGTLMKNRIPGEARALLESDLCLKRKGRGSYQVLTNSDQTLAITKWMDNKPVVMLSSAHAAIETDQCSRWCKTEKRYVQVTRPKVIKEYNSKMGGVDMADRLLAVCPSRARTSKWTVRFISHMFDLAIANSWLYYKKMQLSNGVPPNRIQQLRAYKMQYGEKVIEENLIADLPLFADPDEDPPAKRRPGRLGAVPIPSIQHRQYGNIHLPEILDKQQRCRQSGCNKRSTVKCGECNVALCLNLSRNCFKSFHLKQ